MIKNNYSGRKNTFLSKKSGKKFLLKSILERRYANVIDNSPEVISFDYEPISIPYTDTDGKNRSYKPDFVYVTMYRTIYVVEVKPDIFVKTEEVQLKKKSAITFLSSLYSNFNIFYIIVTENDIKELEERSRVSSPVILEHKNVQRRRTKKKTRIS